MLNKEFYPFKSNFLTFNGLQYHYIDEGKGEPVIMIHGNPTWSYYFRDLIKALSRDYRVIAPDHMGMGLSDRPGDDRYEYKAMSRVKDLERLVAHLRIKKFHLVGHDWGGLIGTGFAVLHPETIISMTMFNTAGFFWPAAKGIPFPLYISRIPLSGLYIRGLNAFLRIAMIVGFKKRISRDIKRGYFHPYTSWKNNIGIHRFVQDIPQKPGDQSYEDGMRVEARLKLLRDVPKIFFWGMKDFVFCPKVLDEWLRHFPDAEVHRYDDAGHFVLEDKIDDIIPKVEKFLKTLPAVKNKEKEIPQKKANKDFINITEHLQEIIKKKPQTLVCASTKGWRINGDAVYETITFQETDKESDNIAHGLEKIGLQKGMKTVFMVPPGTLFFSIFAAILKIGAVPVIVDPGMGIKNLKNCLDEAAPEAFIGIPRAHIGRILLRWAKDSIKINITIGEKKYYPWGGYTLDKVKGFGSVTEPYIIDRPSEEDVLAIGFTSGNTGIPKGVVFTHKMFGAQLKILLDNIKAKDDSVYLATFPPFALLGAANGVTSVIPDMDPVRPASANPRKLLKAMNDFHCTDMFASPAVLELLGKYCEDKNIKLPNIRSIFSAGAPARIDTLERFSRLLPPGAEVFTPYGATEALPVTMVASSFILKEAKELTRNGAGVCVGFPVKGVEVAIIGIKEEAIPRWSSSLKIPAGQIGEICVKGANITVEYYNRPEQTRLAKIYDPKTGETWHRMGDVGYLDKKGRLWMCGRKSHRVETNGRTLFPLPCESIFNNHPKVYRSALVGIIKNGSTMPVICIELEKGIKLKTAEEKILTGELLDLAQKSELTKSINNILYHPRFPVDIRHNSKILREKLTIWAQEVLS